MTLPGFKRIIHGQSSHIGSLETSLAELRAFVVNEAESTRQALAEIRHLLGGGSAPTDPQARPEESSELHRLGAAIDRALTTLTIEVSRRRTEEH